MAQKEAITFQPLVVGTGGQSERKPERIQKAIALLKGKLTFLGRMRGYGTQLAQGAHVRFPTVSNSIVGIDNPESLRCAICSGIHGQPSKGESDWKAHRLDLLTFFSQGSKLVAISQTCLGEYIWPRATAENISNLPEFVARFPKMGAKFGQVGTQAKA